MLMYGRNKRDILSKYININQTLYCKRLHKSGIMEFLWPRQIRNWIEPRCTVSYDVNDTSNLVVDTQCWTTLIDRNTGTLPPVPQIIENVGGPPSPGHFTADNEYLFYRPFANSFDPSTPPQNAFIGGQEVLMQSENIVNHTWINLTFEYSDWLQVNEGGGYVPTQSTVMAGYEPLGAARVQGSNDITFSNCVFEHIGGPWALSITGKLTSCPKISLVCAVQNCPFFS